MLTFLYGGRSSAVEHRTVAPAVVGSIPTARPKDIAMNAKIARIAIIVAVAAYAGAQQKAAEVPVVDAGAGACWVDFTVTQHQKPVYNAKVHAQVRYGLAHKTDVEVGTNYDGKARISGLPQKVRKPPLTFDIRKGNAITSQPHDPAANCHASYDVVLPDITLPPSK
jgi:hypothetical protein